MQDHFDIPRGDKHYSVLQLVLLTVGVERYPETIYDQ